MSTNERIFDTDDIEKIYRNLIKEIDFILRGNVEAGIKDSVIEEIRQGFARVFAKSIRKRAREKIQKQELEATERQERKLKDKIKSVKLTLFHNKKDVFQAIVMKEILDPPISMR